MNATQTVWSASLVAWLLAAAGEVRADDDHPTGSFQIGAGFSSDEHFIAVARVAQDDLFGTGNHLSLQASLSRRRQLFLARFVDPTLFGSSTALGVDLYSDRRALPGFTRQASGASLELSQALGRHTRGFVGYRIEHVAANEEALELARGGPPSIVDDRYLVSAFRAGFAYSTLDRAVTMPFSGSSAGAMIEVADRRFGSEVEMTRATAWANHHRAVGPFVLHVGGTAAVVAGPRAIPRGERLYLESSTEIRGYAPGAIGPVDGFGRPVGGNYKLTGRAELELPVWRRAGISVVGFGDAGVIGDGSQGELGVSAGFGILWRSPIGTLRFDWAFPLDGGPPRFVFGIGTLF
jgi:outer membrane protein insertion porin family